MKNSILLLVFFTAFCLICGSALNTEGSVRDLFRQSWQKIQQEAKSLDGKTSRYTTTTSNDKRNDVTNSEDSGMHSYPCKHNLHAQNMLKAVGGENSAAFDISTIPLPDSSDTFAASNFKRDTSQNMRFHVEDSLMRGKVDPRSCYSVGAKVNVVDLDTGNDVVYTCESEDVLSTDLQNILRDIVIPGLLNVVSSILKVKPSQVMEPLILDSSTWATYGGQCGAGVTIPSSMVSTGVDNADYVLFITARPSVPNYLISHGAACNYEVLNAASQIYGRPLAGVLNLNPRYFQDLLGDISQFDFENKMRAVAHELIHALGFSPMFYDSYIQEDGKLYDSSAFFTEPRLGIAPSGDSYFVYISKLSGPNLIAFAQDYFLCDTLNGIELEDIESSSMPGGHWETRVVGREIMGEYITQLMPITGFTLSVFQDMGWYDVDMSKQEFTSWGKGQGCNFADTACHWSWPLIDGYWCSEGVTQGCTGDRRGKGECGVYEYVDKITPYYQHFENPYLGGLDESLDYCTTTLPTVFCTDTTQVADDSVYESFTDHSICFPYVISSGFQGQACWEYKCDSDGNLQVSVAGQWLACPTEGGALNTSDTLLGMDSEINCPVSSVFCRPVLGEEAIPDVIFPSPSNTPSPSMTPSVTPTSSITPSPSSSVTPSVSITPSITPSTSVTPSISSSVTPYPSGTVPPTQSPSPYPSGTVPPSESPSPYPSGTVPPTQSPSPYPSGTVPPTESPSAYPSGTVPPTESPSPYPSGTVPPSSSASSIPLSTAYPSASPSAYPSGTVPPSHSASPYPSGTKIPSASPSAYPSGTKIPSTSPSTKPISAATSWKASLVLTVAAILFML